MPKDVRTNVIVSGEARGIDKVGDAVAKVNKTAAEGQKAQAKGYADAQKQSALLKKGLEDLAKQQIKVLEEMKRTGDKGSDAYKKLEEQLKSHNQEAQNARQQIQLIDQAYKSQHEAAKRRDREQRDMARRREQEARDQARKAEDDRRMRRGAFTQGLAQGGLRLPTAFLQRGPGMPRQLAGMAVGGMMTAPGYALGGIQGMQQTMAAIPGVGGFLSGQLGAAAGFAQMAAQLSQTQLQGAMFGGGFGQMGPAAEAQGAYSAARRQAAKTINRRREKLNKLVEKQQDRELKAVTDAASKTVTDDEAGVMEKIGAAYLLQSGGQIEAARTITRPITKQVRKLKMVKPGDLMGRQKLKSGEMETDAQALTRLRKAGVPGDQAREIVRTGNVAAEKMAAVPGLGKGQIYGTTTAAGKNLLGVDAIQAAQAEQAIVRAGGGMIRGAREGGFRDTAFAAQTMFGLGPDVTGAFLKAERQGGLTGARGRGRGEGALRDVVADGMKLGLTGSELVDYNQIIAQGIQEFQQTGIPMNKDSIKSMTEQFQRSGIGGARSATLAAGMQRYFQGIGARGVRGGVDVAALHFMGGYQGGGAAEYEQAVLRMEAMSQGLGKEDVVGAKAGSGMMRFIQYILKSAGGGPAARQLLRRTAAEKFGVQMGQAEIGVLSKRAMDPKGFLAQLTPEEKAVWDQTLAQRKEGKAAITGEKGELITGTAKAFAGAAAGTVGIRGGLAKTEAGIRNEQIAHGRAMAGMINTLRRSSLDMNRAFGSLKGPISAVATGMKGLTEHVATMAEKLEKANSFLDGLAELGFVSTSQ